jgi:hypothetical protein
MVCLAILFDGVFQLVKCYEGEKLNLKAILSWRERVEGLKISAGVQVSESSWRGKVSIAILRGYEEVCEPTLFSISGYQDTRDRY